MLLDDVADVQRGELGEVTTAAAAIGNHLKLGAGSYLVQHGDQLKPGFDRRVSCSWATWPTWPTCTAPLAEALAERLPEKRAVCSRAWAASFAPSGWTFDLGACRTKASQLAR